MWCVWLLLCAFLVPTESFYLPPSHRSATTQLSATDVTEFVRLAREMGPVGSYQSEEDQAKLLSMAKDLPESSGVPTELPLSGVHDLIYSAAPGGSSGKLLGPVYGKVTQTFVDDKTFINAVEAGPLQIALRAEREVKSGSAIKVSFKETTIRLFGNTVVSKEMGGGGVWKYLYAGEFINDHGKKKLLRVMETPSLFVIESDL